MNYLHVLKLGLTSFFILCLHLVTWAQSPDLSASVRTFPASCNQVCNGSMELMTYMTLPERYYQWKNQEEGLYHPLNTAVLDGLCPGRYRIRQVDVLFEKAQLSSLSDTLEGGFEGAGLISINTLGKREVSVYIQLDQDVNYLNYYMRSQYSIDGGETWKASSQFHQKVITDISGNPTVYYMMNLPRSASNLKEVRVQIFRRRTDAEHTPPRMEIMHALTESKRVGEFAFNILTEEILHIQSTVSNEINGADGYIALSIQGGTPPYRLFWDDGPEDLERQGLNAGSYSVKVVDRRNCSESAEFMILSPLGVDQYGQFALTQLDNEGVYRLQISGLYRQPLDLSIASTMDSVEVKRFQINPLYEDLKMELDLSFLSPGNYEATLSTSGFSKKSQLLIH